MAEVTLTYISNDGTLRTIQLAEGKVSFGRGSEADERIDDSGLSRLHSTIFREDERIWILDENSTNGTFVNGEPVGPNGAILRNGDKIRIGHETTLTLKIAQMQSATAVAASALQKTVESTGSGIPVLIPLAVAGLALLVIAVSATLIGFRYFGEKEKDVRVYNTPYDTADSDSPARTKTPKGTSTSSASPGDNSAPIDNSNMPTGPTPDEPRVDLPNVNFQQMSEADKNKYVAVKAEKIARMIGNQKSDPIPPEAVQEIRKFLAGYVNRLRSSKRDSCDQGSWVSSDFTSVLTRATRTSPFVVRSFRAESIEPILGIYVAMIEGEHCPCLTSPTGAKGMFQFLASSAPDYGLDPGQRCDPEQSAKAGAKYLKTLIARFGTAPDSVPLAIASFNAGQGNLSKNLDTVFSSTGGQSRSFWTLAANKNILQGGAGKQFNSENIKYVPKFFAAAIIGENPSDFGVQLQPLSTYSK